jgi:hypothetical protein
VVKVERDSRLRSVKLADARERAAAMLSKMAMGERPLTRVAEEREQARQIKEAEAAEKAARLAAEIERVRRKQISFSEIARAYYVYCRRRGLRSADDIEHDIERLLVSVWGDRPVTEIRRADVIANISAIAEAGHPAMARNAFAVCKSLFNWAILAGKLPEDAPSPCDRIKIDALVGKQVPRERVLSDAELRLVWSVATSWCCARARRRVRHRRFWRGRSRHPVRRHYCVRAAKRANVVPVPTNWEDRGCGGGSSLRGSGVRRRGRWWRGRSRRRCR